ncbi:MAG TPA: phosphatase PAP2 family protein [Caulobacteraceae bacterium]
MPLSPSSTGPTPRSPAASPAETIATRLKHAHRLGLHPLVGLLCVSGLLLFAMIALRIANGRTLHLDSMLLIALRTPGDPAKPIGPSWLLQSAIDLSALGGFTFIWLFTLATSGYLALVKRWAGLGVFLAAIVGASVLNALFKFSIHRDRPLVVPHLAEVSNASFPSGHAMISTATYLTVSALLAHTQRSRAVRIYLLSLGVTLSILIGLSRLYLGVHWPSDVLAGWAFGSAWALLFWTLSRRTEAAVGVTARD